MNKPLDHIVIVGGGSAGWMTAAGLAYTVQSGCKITLIESEEIGTIGVGEATIPPIKHFNQRIGIDEAEFMKKTQGTFKLGIEFIDWTRKDHAYFHPFGQYGAEFDTVPFYHHWMRENLDSEASDIDEFSMAWVAARQGRFIHPPKDRRLVHSRMDYAYHFDATLYGRFLREFAEARGVERIEGKVVNVAQDPESGFIQSVKLENGDAIAGDFFIDCTGFFGLLIEKTLKAGYEDWTHWLPCNRAIAVTCERTEPLLPYTKSTAEAAGWRWRIPLQARTGNGHVFSAAHMKTNEAEKLLMDGLDGEPLVDPKHLRFVTGRRKKFWDKNCVAIGLSAGFMEPLESTSLHLIQYGIMRLLAMLPGKEFSPLLAEEYNSLTSAEYDRIRDFLILHYKATEREDSEFWGYCKNMPIPDRLAYKMEHFRSHGLIVSDERELFTNPSWIAVYLGQNVVPRRAPAVTHLRSDVPSKARLTEIKRAIDEAAKAMPAHSDYIENYCRSDSQ